MRQKLDLHLRLLGWLEARGAKGASKTEILQYAQAPVDTVNTALARLLGEYLVVEHEASDSRQGRKPKRYWHKDHAPVLTPPAPDGTPSLDPEADSSPPGGTCRQCGGWTPIVLNRPRDYCSDQCRELARTGGVSRKGLLAQATDPRVYVDLCVLFVMEDLLLRGWLPNFDTRLSGPHLLVHDGANACLLDVLPVPRDGLLPPLEGYASVAIVYTDGRVRFAGTNPLVIETPESENPSA